MVISTVEPLGDWIYRLGFRRAASSCATIRRASATSQADEWLAITTSSAIGRPAARIPVVGISAGFEQQGDAF